MEDRKGTIAVVDDDPRIRRSLARLLATLGYRAILFASASEFLSAADTCDAKCLLVDVQLGETSGLRLAQRLSEAGFQFPIIFMSGSEDDDVRAACLELGCIDYLQKPFGEDRVIAAIAKIESDLQAG